MASVPKVARSLSEAERDLCVEALVLKEKSHERAARASVGPVAEAHAGAAATVRSLIMVLKNHVLEI